MTDSSIGIGYCKYRKQKFETFMKIAFIALLIYCDEYQFNLSLNDSCVLKDIMFLVATLFKSVPQKSVQILSPLKYAQINNVCIAYFSHVLHKAIFYAWISVI